MLVDYVRVYQRAGHVNVGCDPASHPTSDYIDNHLNAYIDCESTRVTAWRAQERFRVLMMAKVMVSPLAANLTTWRDAGYGAPQNSLLGEC